MRTARNETTFIIRFLFFLITFLPGFFLFQFSADAQTVFLRSVLDSPDSFADKQVEVIGEAIGEQLKGRGGVWINISSQGYNIGIFSEEREHFLNIENWGDYGRIGDLVKVSGIFKKNCSLHQISDIHLMALEVVQKGAERKVLLSASKVKVAIGFSIICLTMAVVYLIKKKYGNKI